MLKFYRQINKITLAVQAIALLLVFILASYILRTQILDAHVKLKNEAARFSIALEKSIKDNAYVLSSTSTLYLQGNTPTFLDFSRIVTNLLPRNTAIRALEYVVVVKGEDREAFEREQQVNARNYQITELAPSGRMMRANVRDTYYPVTYSEPLSQNLMTLGYDFGSSAQLKALLMHTADTSLLKLSASRPLIQTGALGVLMVHPIIDLNMSGVDAQAGGVSRGWLVARIEIEKLLMSAGLQVFDPEIDIMLDDVTDPTHPKILYPTEPLQQSKHEEHRFDSAADTYSLTTAVLSVLSGQDLHVALEPFDAFGRSYQINAWASEAFVISEVSVLPIASIFGLWILTGLGMFVLTSSSSQANHRVEMVKHQSKALEESNRLLQQKNNIDDLTGLSNKRYMGEFLNREWQKSLTTRSSFGIILLDLDSFDAFNALYGFPAGDEALVLVAQTLNALLQPKTDLIARFGGEEFIVILPDADRTHGMAERMLNAVADLKIPHKNSATALEFLTISAGVGCFQANPAQRYDSVYKRVDKALRNAKTRGRNQIFEIENYVSNSEDA